VPIGQAAVARPGDDLTIIAYGLMFHESLKAAEKLAQEGVSVEVIDLRTLAPLDKSTILASVKKTGKVLIVYEDNLTGGLGAEVAALIAQEAFEYLDGPITRLAGPDVPVMPFSHPMQDFFLPNAEKIAAAARTLAAY
ncbi:MAG: transketolase C-terminal domain-containing protein, partial [Anaerolineae bacterium]